MRVKKVLLTAALGLTIIASSSMSILAQNISYKIAQGDTFYSISQEYGISLSSLMNANNATSSTVLYSGQIIKVPLVEGWLTHTVVSGDTYWQISSKYGVDMNKLMSANSATSSTILQVGDKVAVPLGPVYIAQAGDTLYKISLKCNISLSRIMSYNGFNENTTLYIGQKVKIPEAEVSTPTPVSTQPYITYSSYTVQRGDNLWSISIKYGIPDAELMKTNGLTASSVLNVGQILKVPVHHVPIISTPSAKYGEYLDWWTQAQYVVPINAVFEVQDFYTGKSFFAKRTTGANHADCEALTYNDTQIMKEIWGGKLSWTSRPVIIKYDGRKIAASCASFAHAGNDAAPGGVYTTWRSGDYGAGTNFDWVKGNGMDGHFDIHFKNSTTHNTGLIEPNHQANIKKASGV